MDRCFSEDLQGIQKVKYNIKFQDNGLQISITIIMKLEKYKEIWTTMTEKYYQIWLFENKFIKY